MRSFTLVCLSLVAVLGRPTTVEAQSRRNTDIRVRVGFPVAPAEGRPAMRGLDLFKPGLWTPVYVDVTAGDDGLSDAKIVVETTDADDVRNNYTVPVPRMNPGESSRMPVIAYTKPASSHPEINTTLQGGGQKIHAQETHFSGLNLGDVLCLTLGSRPLEIQKIMTARQQVAEQQQQQPMGGPPGQRVAAPTTIYQIAFQDSVSRLPSRWFAYAPADLI